MKTIICFCCLALSVGLADGQELSADQRIAAQEKRLKEKPNDPVVEAALASAFIQKLRETTDFAYLNRASVLVGRMLAANPQSYDGIRLSAEIETHRHNFPGAAGLAEKLLRRNPSDAGAMGLLGDCLMELGRYDEAGKVYERMLASSPNLTSYNRVAYQRFVSGDTQKSIDWMGMAIQGGSKTPENLAWCLVEFGDLLFKTGHTGDAHLAYEKALETLPGYHRAYAALGREAAAQGRFAEAEKDFLTAQAVIPLPEYAGALEAIYTKLGSAGKAKEQRSLLDVIDRLARVNGEKGNRMLALVYANENREPERAVAWMEGELPTRHDVYTYDALSWVLLRAGRQREAEAASEKALALHTPEPMFLYHAGIVAISGGNEQAGQDLLRQALALNPEFSYPEANDARERVKFVRPSDSASMKVSTELP